MIFLKDFNKLAVSIAMVVLSNSLYAEWIPEDSLIDLESKTFDVLKDASFKDLKTSVKDALKGSWCSEEKLTLLMELIYLTKPEICVEIGAFTGSTVLPVAVTLKKLNQGKIFVIDPWSNQEAIKNLEDNDPNKPWWRDLPMNDIKNSYLQMEKKWNLSSVTVVLQKTSEEAINQINEIDFLHIDGNFSEQGSLRDVQLYLPKVREGGYILLSNLFLMSNGKQPKLKAFCALFDSCEMVCEIESDNAVLFRKQ